MHDLLPELYAPIELSLYDSSTRWSEDSTTYHLPVVMKSLSAGCSATGRLLCLISLYCVTSTVASALQVQRTTARPRRPAVTVKNNHNMRCVLYGYYMVLLCTV